MDLQFNRVCHCMSCASTSGWVHARLGRRANVTSVAASDVASAHGFRCDLVWWEICSMTPAAEELLPGLRCRADDGNFPQWQRSQTREAGFTQHTQCIAPFVHLSWALCPLCKSTSTEVLTQDNWCYFSCTCQRTLHPCKCRWTLHRRKSQRVLCPCTILQSQQATLVRPGTQRTFPV